MLSAVVDFLLRMIRLQWGSIELHLTACSRRGSAFQMCLPAAEQHRWQHAACFSSQPHFIHEFFGDSGTNRRPSAWRAQTVSFRGGRGRALDHQRGVDAEQEERRSTERGRGEKRKRPEEEMSGKELEGVRLWRTEPHWDLCHVPLRSKQGEKWGEETGRIREPVIKKEKKRKRMQNFKSASGVKFLWMIPTFPTRLIKLWLC